MIPDSAGRKAKAAGAEPSGQMRWQVERRCGGKHISESAKMYKTHQRRTTLGRWHVEKSARRLSTKHMWKSKRTKHSILRPLLEIEMLIRRAPSWREAREAHVEDKMTCDKCDKGSDKSSVKNWRARSDVILPGRRKGVGTLSGVSKTWRFCSSFNHYHNSLHVTSYMTLRDITWHYMTLHCTDYIALDDTTLHYNYMTLHDTTRHDTTRHYTDTTYDSNCN